MRKALPYQRDAIKYVAEPDRDCIGLYMEKRLGKCLVSTYWAVYTGSQHVLIVAPLSAIPDWINELEADGQRVTDCTHPGDLHSYLGLRSTTLGQHFAIINAEGLFSPAGAKVTCKSCLGSGSQTKHYSQGEFGDLYQEPCDLCDGKGKIARGQPAPYPIALLDWDMVIWDESIKLKNPQSQVTKVAHACFYDVKHKAILSGEYAPEGPEDIFEPMVWCFGDFMGYTKFWPWRDEYFNSYGYDWHPKFGAMKKIKTAVMEKCYVLSRKDAGVGETKFFERRYCKLPRKFRKLYDHCEKYFELPLAAVPDHRVNESDSSLVAGGISFGPAVRYTKYAPVLHGWLTQLASGYPKAFPEIRSTHKMDLLAELVTGEFSREPLVVSFAHNAELFAAKERLTAQGVTCEAVWGSMPGGKLERRRLVASFQKGEYRVILKQAKIHFGMNLSRASTMIRYSLPYSYNDISQDMDRIVNPATKQGVPLAYIDLVTQGTVDEDNRDAASDKRLIACVFNENREARFRLRTEKQHGR